MFNHSCTKVLGTHTFYEGGARGGGGGGEEVEPTSIWFQNDKLYKLQLWHAIKTIHER